MLTVISNKDLDIWESEAILEILFLKNITWLMNHLNKPKQKCICTLTPPLLKQKAVMSKQNPPNPIPSTQQINPLINSITKPQTQTQTMLQMPKLSN